MKSREISICALMPDPYDTTPSQRFRIEQWEPFLKQKNIKIEYFSFTDERLRKILYQSGHFTAKVTELLKANLRRIGQVLKAKKYDAVFLHRAASIIGPAWLEKYLHFSGTPIIFDFDDAIFMTDVSDANRRFAWAKFSGKTDDICRYSTSITVGNSYLAEYARKHNENVYIVPTSIDTIRYQPKEKSVSKNGRVVIGWTGSSTSQYHLEAFEPILSELIQKRGEDVEIRVISNREPSFQVIPYTWRAWSPETEIKEIAEIDIGIMPTPDDDWARGKCALKALQYMSLGIPAICTDMGANRDVINQGENGFLAKTTEQWLNYFETLIDNKELRLILGNRARETIVKHYSMEKCAELFAEVVEKSLKNISWGDSKD
jgi:glycosyltransferase involved in cell wall biosynthesis